MAKSIYLRLQSNFDKIHCQLFGNRTKHNPDTWTVKWDTQISWIDFDLAPLDEVQNKLHDIIWNQVLFHGKPKKIQFIANFGKTLPLK